MSAENWNKIVAEYNKNRNSKEDIVQRTWEMLFSFVFNYSVLEIDSQRPVKMGCSTKFADIVIKNGHDDLFVVELKRHTLHDGQEQLFSYLKQLKMNLGVLVCDKLYIYDYNLVAREDSFSELEIPFVLDNPDGIRFVELFSKGNFDEQKIKEFIRARSIKNSIKKELIPSLIADLLETHFSKKYPPADAKKTLSEFSFSITQTAQPSQVEVSTPSMQNQPEQGRDYSEYTLNGERKGPKRPTVFAAVKLYVENNPGISFFELQQAFASCKHKVVIQSERVKDRGRFYPELITLSNGEEVAVSNQWSKEKMGSKEEERSFIYAASKLGMEIKPI